MLVEARRSIKLTKVRRTVARSTRSDDRSIAKADSVGDEYLEGGES